MIIRTGESSLLLITQPDHAALAERIMRHWASDDLLSSPRRADILRSVEWHDNGWLEVDRTPIVDETTGQLCDFMTAPHEVRTGVWPRGVERLRETPYVAALVAAHAIYVYDRYREDAPWLPFFTEMIRARDRHLAASSIDPDVLQQDYRFLRLGDLLSLTFCNAWPEPQADAFGYRLRFDGTRLSVTPDPFAGREVAMEITARRLPRRTFSSAADAAQAWESAPMTMLSAVASGA
jgi:hypothetical protein